jgi:uncharacterized protein involved in response to NO
MASISKNTNTPLLLSYGFRPFFLLAPSYLVLNIILWSAMWAGLISLDFTGNWLQWHIYELLFGVTSAMMIGFVLTSVPELVEGAEPIQGKPLLLLVVLWILGRISFWLLDWVGVTWVALINIPLLWLLIAMVIRPILSDPMQRQYALLSMFALVALTQIAFFATVLGWLAIDSMAMLKFAVGIFMMLVLVAVRLINMRAVNELFTQRGITDTFYARTPFYNIAVLAVFIYSLFELLMPNNPLLVWLAFAAMAGVLSTLSDFFNTDTPILRQRIVWPLFSILLLLASGYGSIAISGLLNDFTEIRHYRHLLTTGALGLAYFMVLIIVTHTHTGRSLIPSRWVSLGVVLIILASLIRAYAVIYAPHKAAELYSLSAIMWALPYLGFLILYGKWLREPALQTEGGC